MRKAALLSSLLALVVALSLGGVWAQTRPTERVNVQAELSLSDALSTRNDSGFKRITAARDFDFPRDHGPHADYAIEWWYFTGNLDAAANRHFGYELTLFRIGLSSEEPDSGDSDWSASQVFMGHFALTDVENDRFYDFERFSRQALGLANATFENDSFAVWLEDWSVQGDGQLKPSVKLTAEENGIAIDLSLISAKPLVLQGEDGLSHKSADEGNASYYYSATRMQTSGVVSIAGDEFSVKGSSWMDREWSTTALSADQVGWDWFALQLSDGRDLMYYQLRQQDGQADPFSSGILVMPDGSSISLASGDVEIEVLDTWTSPQGIEYPSRWRLSVPSAGLELELVPYIADQVLNVSITYWEGAVRVSGTADGLPVQGQGYVELTGYAGESGGRS
jgi:predicted secreted hydrolase